MKAVAFQRCRMNIEHSDHASRLGLASTDCRDLELPKSFPEPPFRRSVRVSVRRQDQPT